MLEQILEFDQQVFLLLNSWHSGVADFLMYWLSNKPVWIPLYVFLIFLVIKAYRRKAIVVLLMVVLLITISDQVSVHLFKNVFLRLRPCHEPSLQGMVRAIDGCGGKYGFISSHASNSFALAVFMVLAIGRRYHPYILLMLVWAAGVCYSRIYLGAHYPGDVLAGAVVGSIEAAFVYFLMKYVLGQINKRQTCTGRL